VLRLDLLCTMRSSLVFVMEYRSLVIEYRALSIGCNLTRIRIEYKYKYSIQVYCPIFLYIFFLSEHTYIVYRYNGGSFDRIQSYFDRI